MLLWSAFITAVAAIPALERKGHGHGHGSNNDSCTTAEEPDLSYRYVYDDFSKGFDVGPGNSSSKWVYFESGQFTGNDGIETTGPEGLTVVNKGVSAKGEPAFTSWVPNTLPGADNINHVKYMALTNHKASSGVTGFDTKPGYIFSCEGRFSAELYGINDGPFKDVAPPNYQPFGSAHFCFADFEKAWIFHLGHTNDRYWAAYERLAYTPDHEYASFTYVIPIGKRKPCAEALLRVEYDRDLQEVAWFVNNEELFRIGDLGGYKDEFAEHIIMDRGGTPEKAGDINQIACGVGLLSTIDAFNLNLGKGYVKLTTAPGYYKDPRTHSGNVTFLEDVATMENQNWGQGGKLRLRELIVANRKKEMCRGRKCK